MFGITDIAAYLVGVIVIILLPGPNSLYCLSVAAAHGKKAGWRATAGVLCGDTLLIIATVLGAGTLLKLYPAVFDAIKLLGGAYLAYMGVQIFRGAYQTFKHRKALANSTPKLAKLAAQNYFLRSLSLSLTNPKAILFFLSFFVQFIDPAYPRPLVTFFALAVILQTVSFAYLALLVMAGKGLALRFASRPWLSIIAMSAVGTLFIGFAINLWQASL